MCVSVSWLLQGLSQPDKRRDWRPRPRSVTPGGPLDDCMSWEPGMPPQLGKSILLLPTAASSDSFRSEIQFRNVEKEERESVRRPQGTQLLTGECVKEKGQGEISHTNCFCKRDISLKTSLIVTSPPYPG